MVLAIKNGYTRTFSDTAWKLLGTDKYGWVEVTEAGVSNNIPAKISEFIESAKKKQIAEAVISEDNKIVEETIETPIEIKKTNKKKNDNKK